MIADTHGTLRDEALALLADVDHIVHAGDIGDPEILARLAAIAPLTAVRGNNDEGDWADALPEHVTIELAGARVHVTHERAKLAIDPRAERTRVVITGHSHRASIEKVDGVLFLDPGGAGPRRFSLPITIAMLEISDGEIDARILPLSIATSVKTARTAKRPTR